MYDYPFSKGEPGSEDGGEEEEVDIARLFETDNPRIRSTMAQLAYAHERAVLEGDKDFENLMIKTARELKASREEDT